jgi:hypothetical protein
MTKMWNELEMVSTWGLGDILRFLKAAEKSRKFVVECFNREHFRPELLIFTFAGFKLTVLKSRFHVIV